MQTDQLVCSKFKGYHMKIIIAILMLTVAIFAKQIPAYFVTKYQDENNISEKLSQSGFRVIGSYTPMENNDYKVIAFTSKPLLELASKPRRGFAAVQKVLVDKQNKKLYWTNPEYFLSAFLQKEYDPSIALDVRDIIHDRFEISELTEETMDEDDLGSYHFTFGMPYYEDMTVVGEKDNVLLNVAIQKHFSSNIVFKLELESSTLYGISMFGQKGEGGFIPKINGLKNMAYLPYMVLVEDNQAKIMPAKYYMGLAFPNMGLGDFMSISGTPDDIKEYFEKAFEEENL